MTAFTIGGEAVAPGTRQRVDLKISTLANATSMDLPVHVVNGQQRGPTFFLSAAVHGDEIQGVEIIRRVLLHPALREVKGTLLAVPIVNHFGFITHSRYMADRRDLNRSFPGSDRGSLASLLADLFFREVVLRCQYGVDLHTAALHRMNLPQIYEGGEALRFDEPSIEAGVKGVLRVMAALGMIAEAPRTAAHHGVTIATASTWVRAPEGGILHTLRRCGDRVGRKEVIGVVADPVGGHSVPVVAADDGMIIGRTQLPLVNRGDALFHIARAAALSGAKGRSEGAVVADEDEII